MGIFKIRAINELVKRTAGQQPQEIKDPDEVDNQDNNQQGDQDNNNQQDESPTNSDDETNDTTTDDNEPDVGDPNDDDANDYTRDPDEDEVDNEPATDYTTDPDDTDTTEDNNDDTTNDDANNDDATDYTEDPDDNDVDNEPATDYTTDPDEDNTEDNNDDTDSEDTTEDDQQQVSGASGELKTIEGDLFKDLSPEQLRLKNIELKQQYIEVYGTITATLTRLEKVVKNDENTKPLKFITEKLSELKDLVSYYLRETYDTKSYIENNVMYQKYLVVLNTVTEMLDKLKIKE